MERDRVLSAYETIEFTRNGRILVVSMNTGSPRNAVNEIFHSELGRVFFDIRNDPDSDVIILTGSGTDFCAGGDFNWFQQLIDRPEDWIKHVIPTAKSILSGLLEMEKPIICRLNGPAAGLGASIALLCDIIVASENARIGDPHVKVGLVAGDGGAVIWPQLIGFARAKEMLLTGRMLTAGEALNLGLLNHVVPADQLDEKVDELAQELVQGATLAIRWTKAVINLELQRIHAQTTDAALAYETITNGSFDHQEAVTAFKERRAPRFRGC